MQILLSGLINCKKLDEFRFLRGRFSFMEGRLIF